MTANHRDALPEVLPLPHFFSVAVDTYTSEFHEKQGAAPCYFYCLPEGNNGYALFSPESGRIQGFSFCPAAFITPAFPHSNSLDKLTSRQ